MSTHPLSSSFHLLQSLPTVHRQKYLASNVYFNVSGREVPLNRPFRFWTTPNERKVAALGVSFDLNSRMKDNGVRIESVEDMVRRPWVRRLMPPKRTLVNDERLRSFKMISLPPNPTSLFWPGI